MFAGFFRVCLGCLQIFRTKKKVFEHYLDFPAEVRMMIIDEMNADDRCRFTRCSTLSRHEVQRSKKLYVSELHLICYYGRTLIEVVYGESYGERHGFVLDSEEKSNKNTMKCKQLDGRTTMWVKKYDKSQNMVYPAAQEFNKLLQLHQKSLKTLVMKGQYDMDVFVACCDEIQSFDKLEEFQLADGIDARPFLLKIPHSLKSFTGTGNRRDRNLADCEHIYQVQNCLISHYTRLNHKQFLQLSASKVTMNIGELTEMNIFDFIRYWQRGSATKKMEYYEWHLFRSEISVLRLFSLLGVDFDGLSEYMKMDVNQFSENGKRAELIYRTRKVYMDDMDNAAYFRSTQLVFSVLH